MLSKLFCDPTQYYNLYSEDTASVRQRSFWGRFFCWHKYLRVKDHDVTHGYNECHKCGKRKKFWFMDIRYSRF